MKAAPRVWLFTLVAVLAASCNLGGGPSQPSVSIVSPEGGESVRGNVVTLEVEAMGITIAAADGDTSGETGHFHVFVDRTPVAIGETIPNERGIVHSADTSILVPGLSVGEHTLSVVLGDGRDARISEAAEVTINVEGPSVTFDPGVPELSFDNGTMSITFEVNVEGVDIVPADGDTSGRTGHLHVFIDPATPPTADGNPIPGTDGVLHTAETRITVPVPSGDGEVSVYVVLGDGNHVPFDPLVMDLLVLNF